MAVSPDKPAPYAPASTILELIQRHRQKGLPSPVTAEVLQRAGTPDSLIPRTYQSLQTLDLIDDKGNVTQVFEDLRKAPEVEFKDRLSEWLKAAYADALNYVNPAVDDETRVRDAFRSYNPIGQQPRMVSLFLGLAAAAGMAGEKATPQQRRPRPASTPFPRKIVRAQEIGGAPNKTNIGASSHGGAGSLNQSHLPLPLRGLLSSLPTEGGSWSQAQRDKFIATFEAVIDFCYRIEEETTSSEAKSGQAHAEEGR